jgi:hypothetical protein
VRTGLARMKKLHSPFRRHNLSKLNSVNVEVDVRSRRARTRTDKEHPSTSRTPTGVIAPIFPRKEVIQPQLPLRLPCYDFVPITSPAFDGSLPCGLGRRLRALPAFVT